MSIDDGAFILVSRGRKNQQREYRVIHAQASVVDGITSQPDYPAANTVLNIGYLLSRFGTARVFTDRRLAEAYALRISDEMNGQLEHGIVFIEDFAHIRFPQKAFSRQPKLSAVS